MSKFRNKRDVDNKPTRYYSDIQEKRVAKAIGGQQTANSGATPYDKGDVKDNNGWRIECKTKTKDSEQFTIKKEWLDKNISESIFMKNKYTALAFNFGPDSKNYYILDESTFLLAKDLLDEYGE